METLSEQKALLEEVEEYHNRKSAWLLENHYTDRDVHVDSDGEEFVFEESDNGNPDDEGYAVGLSKIYLNKVIFEHDN